jgi:hypothetical protein
MNKLQKFNSFNKLLIINSIKLVIILKQVHKLQKSQLIN